MDMSNKPTYVDVMRDLAQYACDNLNMETWRNGDHKEKFDNIDDNIDALAPLRAKSDLGGDDLDMIELIMEVEEQYDVEISDDWVGKRGDDPTLGELAELVVALRK
ncbi:acyl carrier protein [Salmonella phage Vi01]|uniref:Acyl carrier protein n=1 Tax=Salmonella phage ViI TaxID=1987993 RepID=E1XTD1_BPSAV|nr:acyl carrier protein [Salmonella phage Vi01]CBW37990.1 acyl carrier protein [Salmonella phage Vi01]